MIPVAAVADEDHQDMRRFAKDDEEERGIPDSIFD